MRLPPSISVSVQVADGQPVNRALVYLNILTLGQDYWRTFVGLTDATGTSRVTASEVQRWETATQHDPYQEVCQLEGSFTTSS
jgi:hypothetical protein